MFLFGVKATKEGYEPAVSLGFSVRSAPRSCPVSKHQDHDTQRSLSLQKCVHKPVCDATVGAPIFYMQLEPLKLCPIIELLVSCDVCFHTQVYLE